MNRFNTSMVAALSLVVALLLSTSALAQPIKRDEIFGYLARNGPKRGTDNAPVTLIEFSDFRCSFCRKFWEYHDKLFASAGSPLAFTDGKLKSYAKELGLKSQAFNQCLDSGKQLKKVEGETAIAFFLGARGTPAFFLNGQMLVGAQPFHVFETLIKKELNRAPSSGKTTP